MDCKCKHYDGTEYNHFIKLLESAFDIGDFQTLTNKYPKNIDVKYKKIDKSLETPKYETDGAVGLDLYAREDTLLAPGKFTLIPTNIIMEVPQNHMLVLTGRSSTSYKHGKIIILGIIDQDYNGENDEIKLQAWNPSNKEEDAYIVKKGQKLGQALLVNISKANLIEVNNMNETSRGGFGSTDVNV